MQCSKQTYVENILKIPQYNVKATSICTVENFTVKIHTNEIIIR